MRHLKLFENLNDKYYTEISAEDFYSNEGLLGKRDFFTDREMKWFRSNTEILSTSRQRREDPNEIYSINGRSRRGNRISFTIYRIEDDYYGVSLGSEFKLWKCDQWEGLMKFLKDKKII